jgi:hypothetical protein
VLSLVEVDQINSTFSLADMCPALKLKARAQQVIVICRWGERGEGESEG